MRNWKKIGIKMSGFYHSDKPRTCHAAIIFWFSFISLFTSSFYFFDIIKLTQNSQRILVAPAAEIVNLDWYAMDSGSLKVHLVGGTLAYCTWSRMFLAISIFRVFCFSLKSNDSILLNYHIPCLLFTVISLRFLTLMGYTFEFFVVVHVSLSAMVKQVQYNFCCLTGVVWGRWWSISMVARTCIGHAIARLLAIVSLYAS